VRSSHPSKINIDPYVAVRVMRSRKYRFGVSTAVTVIIMVVILVAAASSGYYIGGSVGKTTVPTTSTDPSQALVACSKAEGGAVTVYGLFQTNGFNQVFPPAFQAAFPWTHVTYQGENFGDLYTTLAAQNKSGQVKADVVSGPLSILNPLNMWATFDNPVASMMAYPPGSLDPQNVFQPGYGYYVLLAYNTNLVKNTTQLPQTWQQFFTDSAFKGKLAYGTPASTSDTGPVLWWLKQNQSMSNSSWVSYLQAAKANQPTLTPDDGTALQDIVSGQAEIGIVGLNDLISTASTGAPVAPLWINPGAIGLRSPFVITSGAPHPCTARLFVEWMSSLGGQLAQAAYGNTPQLSQAVPPKMLFPPSSNSSAVFDDTTNFFANTNYMDSVFTQVFGSSSGG
jgi:iron(III) transport system substrate-binding protein